MLDRFDDFPIHQTAEPVRHPQSGHVTVAAQAMALLGRLEGDHLLLLDAIDLLQALGETETLGYDYLTRPKSFHLRTSV